MEKEKIEVLDQRKDVVTYETIVKRIGCKLDPTPYILCSGYKEDNGKVSWNFGKYFSDLKSATEYFYKQ